MSALSLFDLEYYLKQRETQTRLSLSSADGETLSLLELLALSTPETQQQWERCQLYYTAPSGLPALRQAIAAHQYDMQDAAHILPTTGVQEAMFVVFQTLLDADDHAVVVTPCYQPLLSLPASRCAVTEVRLNPLDCWQLNPDDIRHALRPNTRVVVVNVPHNPTGMLPDRATWQDLISIISQHGAYLLADEIFRWSEIEEADRLSCAADSYERGISMSGLSKAFGLAGLRVGWIATPDSALRQQCEQTRYYTSICASAPSEWLAVMALEAKEAIVARTMAICRQNYAVLSEWIERYHESGLGWIAPKAAGLGLVELPLNQLQPGLDDSHGSLLPWADRLLSDHGLLVTPGELFYQPGPYIRVSLWRHSMPEALTILESHLGLP